MTSARTFQESMFVLVSKRADSQHYPVALKGALLLFTTAETARAFLHGSRGLPEGSAISRESGWERVIGVMQLARDEGATLVAVDPGATTKAVPLDESIKALQEMLEQVALTATALLRRLLIACAARMGKPKPNMTLAEGVEVFGRVVRTLAPQGEMADAAKSIEVFVRSLAAKAAEVEPAPRFVFAPEGAIGVFVPWVEARLDLLSGGRGRGGASLN